ncbi:hypothetical protein A3Q56_04908, partial [Intoshia linei]
ELQLQRELKEKHRLNTFQVQKPLPISIELNCNNQVFENTELADSREQSKLSSNNIIITIICIKTETSSRKMQTILKTITNSIIPCRTMCMHALNKELFFKKDFCLQFDMKKADDYDNTIVEFLTVFSQVIFEFDQFLRDMHLKIVSPNLTCDYINIDDTDSIFYLMKCIHKCTGISHHYQELHIMRTNTPNKDSNVELIDQYGLLCDYKIIDCECVILVSVMIRSFFKSAYERLYIHQDNELKKATKQKRNLNDQDNSQEMALPICFFILTKQYIQYSPNDVDDIYNKCDDQVRNEYASEMLKYTKNNTFDKDLSCWPNNFNRVIYTIDTKLNDFYVVAIRIDASKSIYSVKKAFRYITQIRESINTLVYGKHILQDNKSLAEYQIVTGSMVYSVCCEIYPFGDNRSILTPPQSISASDISDNKKCETKEKVKKKLSKKLSDKKSNEDMIESQTLLHKSVFRSETDENVMSDDARNNIVVFYNSRRGNQYMFRISKLCNVKLLMKKIFIVSGEQVERERLFLDRQVMPNKNGILYKLGIVHGSIIFYCYRIVQTTNYNPEITPNHPDYGKIYKREYLKSNNEALSDANILSITTLQNDLTNQSTYMFEFSMIVENIKVKIQNNSRSIDRPMTLLSAVQQLRKESKRLIYRKDIKLPLTSKTFHQLGIKHNDHIDALPDSSIKDTRIRIPKLELDSINIWPAALIVISTLNGERALVSPRLYLTCKSFINAVKSLFRYKNFDIIKNHPSHQYIFNEEDRKNDYVNISIKLYILSNSTILSEFYEKNYGTSNKYDYRNILSTSSAIYVLWRIVKCDENSKNLNNTLVNPSMDDLRSRIKRSGSKFTSNAITPDNTPEDLKQSTTTIVTKKSKKSKSGSSVEGTFKSSQNRATIKSKIRQSLSKLNVRKTTNKLNKEKSFNESFTKNGSIIREKSLSSKQITKMVMNKSLPNDSLNEEYDEVYKLKNRRVSDTMSTFMCDINTYDVMEENKMDISNTILREKIHKIRAILSSYNIHYPLTQPITEVASDEERSSSSEKNSIDNSENDEYFIQDVEPKKKEKEPMINRSKSIFTRKVFKETLTNKLSSEEKLCTLQGIIDVFENKNLSLGRKETLKFRENIKHQYAKLPNLSALTDNPNCEATTRMVFKKTYFVCIKNMDRYSIFRDNIIIEVSQSMLIFQLKMLISNIHSIQSDSFCLYYKRKLLDEDIISQFKTLKGVGIKYDCIINISFNGCDSSNMVYKELIHENLQANKIEIINSGYIRPLTCNDKTTNKENGESLNFDRLGLLKLPIFPADNKIKFISAQCNKISGIREMSNYNNLIIMDLCTNNIDNVQVFSNIVNLRVLILSNNKIKHLKQLQSLKYLQILDVHNNEISKIDKMDTLTNLNILNLANNRLTTNSLGDSLKKLDNLTQLNLNHNYITKIEDERRLCIKIFKRNCFIDEQIIQKKSYIEKKIRVIDKLKSNMDKHGLNGRMGFKNINVLNLHKKKFVSYINNENKSSRIIGTSYVAEVINTTTLSIYGIVPLTLINKLPIKTCLPVLKKIVCNYTPIKHVLNIISFLINRTNSVDTISIVSSNIENLVEIVNLARFNYFCNISIEFTMHLNQKCSISYNQWRYFLIATNQYFFIKDNIHYLPKNESFVKLNDGKLKKNDNSNYTIIFNEKLIKRYGQDFKLQKINDVTISLKERINAFYYYPIDLIHYVETRP